jgi:hypothetical protein
MWLLKMIGMWALLCAGLVLVLGAVVFMGFVFAQMPGRLQVLLLACVVLAVLVAVNLMMGD